MKVALAIERFDQRLGGQAVWTTGFAAHLLRSGHEVHVVSTGFGPHGLPVVAHAVPWAWSPLRRAAEFQRQLSTVAADAVHDAGTTYSAGVLQPHAASDLGSLDRLIATEPPLRRLRAAASPKMLALRSQMAWLERAQAGAATRIVAVSAFARDVLVARHPASRAKIQVVRNGVDTLLFDPAALRVLRTEARVRFALGDDTAFVAAAHNLRLKGIDTALRALADLMRTGESAQLVVAGGEPSPEFLALASSLGVDRRVRFVGHVADMRLLYAAADVLVHPTRWDACSLVVLEGLASGLPVITTQRNGAAELIAHGDSGFVLEHADDVAALAAHMRLLLDPDRRTVIGNRARQAAVPYGISGNYAGVEQLLAECARVGKAST